MALRRFPYLRTVPRTTRAPVHGLDAEGRQLCNKKTKFEARPLPADSHHWLREDDCARCVKVALLKSAKEEPEPDADGEGEDEEEDHPTKRHDWTKRGPGASKAEVKKAIAGLEAGRTDVKTLRRVVDSLDNARHRQTLHDMIDGLAEDNRRELARERRRIRKELDIWG